MQVGPEPPGGPFGFCTHAGQTGDGMPGNKEASAPFDGLAPAAATAAALPLSCDSDGEAGRIGQAALRFDNGAKVADSGSDIGEEPGATWPAGQATHRGAGNGAGNDAPGPLPLQDSNVPAAYCVGVGGVPAKIQVPLLPECGKHGCPSTNGVYAIARKVDTT